MHVSFKALISAFGVASQGVLHASRCADTKGCTERIALVGWSKTDRSRSSGRLGTPPSMVLPMAAVRI